MSDPLTRAITILAWLLIAFAVLSGVWQFVLIFTGTIEIGGGPGGFLVHALGLTISVLQTVVAPVTLLFVMKLYADNKEARS